MFSELWQIIMAIGGQPIVDFVDLTRKLAFIRRPDERSAWSVYVQALKRYAVAVTMAPLVLLVVGIMSGAGWIVGLVGVFWALCTIVLFFIAGPIGVLVEIIGDHAKGDGKRYVWMVESILAFETGFTLYVIIVPIGNNPGMLPVVIIGCLLLLFMNLAAQKPKDAKSQQKAAPVSRKLVTGVVVTVIMVATIGFYMPNLIPVGNSWIGYANERILALGKPGLPPAALTTDQATLNLAVRQYRADHPAGTAASYSSDNSLHNPLNIKYSAQVAALGGMNSGVAAADGGTFARFASSSQGLQAGKNLLLSSTYSGLSVDGAMRKWSNSGYGGGIVSGTDISPNQTVASLNDSQVNELLSLMIQHEGGTPVSSENLVALPPTAPGQSQVDQQPASVRFIGTDTVKWVDCMAGQPTPWIWPPTVPGSFSTECDPPLKPGQSIAWYCLDRRKFVETYDRDPVINPPAQALFAVSSNWTGTIICRDLRLRRVAVRDVDVKVRAETQSAPAVDDTVRVSDTVIN